MYYRCEVYLGPSTNMQTHTYARTHARVHANTHKHTHSHIFPNFCNNKLVFVPDISNVFLGTNPSISLLLYRSRRLPEYLNQLAMPDFSSSNSLMVNSYSGMHIMSPSVNDIEKANQSHSGFSLCVHDRKETYGKDQVYNAIDSLPLRQDPSIYISARGLSVTGESYFGRNPGNDAT